MTIHQLIDRIEALATRDHYVCGPAWHTCPKSREDSAQEECFCGADTKNAIVTTLLGSLRHWVKEHSHDDTCPD